LPATPAIPFPRKRCSACGSGACVNLAVKRVR
jgi:ArsR family metal-binding transcriptional regulator